MSDVPFAVKEFGVLPLRRGRSFPDPRDSITYRMNTWFAELAEDATREYDIRQVLPFGEAVFVFYEVAPAKLA